MSKKLTQEEAYQRVIDRCKEMSTLDEEIKFLGWAGGEYKNSNTKLILHNSKLDLSWDTATYNGFILNGYKYPSLGLIPKDKRNLVKRKRHYSTWLESEKSKEWLSLKPKIEEQLKTNIVSVEDLAKKYGLTKGFFKNTLTRIGLSVYSKLERYTNRYLPHTRKFLIKNLEKNPDFIMDKGILLKEDFIEQYYLSGEKSGKKIFNYDFSGLPDIINSRKEKVDIYINEVSTKTRKTVGCWSTSFKELIVLEQENGALAGMESKSKTSQYIDTTEFIRRSKEKFGEDIYGYDRVNYVNQNTPVELFCKICGKYFFQKPNEHLLGAGHGCPECAMKEAGREKLKPLDEVISLIEDVYGVGEWDFSDMRYTNPNSTISVKDAKTGKYYTRHSLYSFIGNDPRNEKRSIGECQVEKWLAQNEIKFKPQYRLFDIEGRNSNRVFVDFFLEDLNIFLEVNGKQHYKYRDCLCITKASKEETIEYYRNQIKRDDNLRNYSLEKNITLVEIPYTYISNDTSLLYETLERIILRGESPDIIVQPEIERL